MGMTIIGQPRECTWTYDGSCYYLIEHAEEFFTAESECVIKYGGHLIAITSEEESNFITVQLLNKYGSTDMDKWIVWTGGFQDDTGEWIWTSSYENWNFTNWDTATSQPDLGADACAVFYGVDLWRWADTECSYQ